MIGITESLFGVSPSTPRQDFEYAAKNLSGLSASQIGGAQLYSAGRQLGKGLMKATGVEDPEMASANKVKAATAEVQQRGINTQTSQGMKAVAQLLNQQGESALAFKATQVAQVLEEKEVGINLKEAQTFQATQKGIQATRERDPEIIRLQNARDQLQEQFGPNDRRVLELNRILEGKAKAGQTNISISDKGKSAFAQGLGAEDAKRVSNAEKLIDTASNELATLKKMQETNNLGVISGTGANARIEALKFLDTAGFTTPAQKNTLAASENFNKLTGDLILARIKQLGTNPSNADRDFVARIVPDLATSAQARQQLIDYMATRANQVINEARRLSKYGRENDGLKNYVPEIPLVGGLPTDKKDISEYTLEELEELRRNAKPAGAKR